MSKITIGKGSDITIGRGAKKVLIKMYSFYRIINTYIETGDTVWFDIIRNYRAKNPKEFYLTIELFSHENSEDYKNLEVKTRPAGFNG